MFEACHPHNVNATFPVILPRPTDHLLSNVCPHSTQQSRAISTLFNTSGPFVEFGGNDGFHESNTRHLECRGWRGVLIEPLRHPWSKSCVNRPRAISVRSAVCETHAFVDISIPGKRTAASGIRHHMSQLSIDVFLKKSMEHNENVPCRPFSSIVSRDQCIDYLSIDVEGAEWSILKTFEFKVMCIHAISVEMHASNKQRNQNIFKQLTENGFILVKTIPIWRMHIADEMYVNSTFLPGVRSQKPRIWLRPSPLL